MVPTHSEQMKKAGYKNQPNLLIPNGAPERNRTAT